MMLYTYNFISYKYREDIYYDRTQYHNKNDLVNYNSGRFIDNNVVNYVINNYKGKSYNILEYSFYNKGIIKKYIDNNNLGAIVEDKEVKVYLWNSDLYNSKTIFSIIKNPINSASYLVPDITDYSFNPNEEIVISIIVPKEGNIIADTEFILNYENGSVNLNITGLRTVVLFFDNIKDLQTELSYNVVVSSLKNGKEYRKLVNDNVNFSISFSSNIKNTSNIENMVKFGFNKFVILPIYNNTYNISSINGNSIILSDDISNDFFIKKLCKYIYIYDGNSYNIYEIKDIDYDNNIIYTINDINIDSDISLLKLYVGNLFIINNFNVVPITGRLSEIKIEAKKHDV